LAPTASRRFFLRNPEEFVVIEMENVEGLMGKMKLSEEERGGVTIGGGGSRWSRTAEPQVIRKVMAEKLVAPETLERTLGCVWCPIKGINCKDLGENHFLFTFLLASGKRRALRCFGGGK
jgi:hypothetical protein